MSNESRVQAVLTNFELTPFARSPWMQPAGEFRPPWHTHGFGAGGYCLWQRFLRFEPEDPIWPNCDRFYSFKRTRFNVVVFPFAPRWREGRQSAIRDARPT